MQHKSKREIPHEELDKSTDSVSGRFKKIGSRGQLEIKDPEGKTQQIVPMVLQDKVIYEINVCPYCGSKATFHQRVTDNEDVIGNVWRAEQFLTEQGFSYRKFDYCLDCLREFLIELYIWEKEKGNSNSKT